MPSDDRLKRYQDAGAEFIETARTRAEELLRDLGALGESTGRQASGSLEDALAGGRRGGDQVFEVIRREIAAQLSLLGIATKADLDDLERRLTGRRAPAAKKAAGASPAKKAAGASPAKKAAGASPARKAAGTRGRKAAASSSPAERAGGASAARKAAGVSKRASSGR